MDVLQIPSDAGGLKTLKAVGPKERRTLRKLPHFWVFFGDLYDDYHFTICQ